MLLLRLGFLTSSLCLLGVVSQQTGVDVLVDVIGWPTVTLPAPSEAILMGITIRFDEPDFMRVNKSIDQYLGVPFAEPPIGELRFEDPRALIIKGEYDATTDRDECPQMSPITRLPRLPSRNISEDCLYLSIYTPSPRPSSLVPVLVWIHGGGYAVGGGSEIIYDPVPIVALSDIIVVNVNYRLGVFGFLTTGDDIVTGNQGMMDQVLALQWVKDNIEAFGGNPDQVTIAGESAGGASVGLHMLSPLSEGLFHRSILQSGNAACPWAWTTTELAAEAHREFAGRANCTMENSLEMVECLRGVDADRLILLQVSAGNGALSSPVVDGDFLPDDPVEMMKRQNFKVLPSLIGANEDEAAINFAFLDLPSSLLEPPVVNISYFRTMLPRLVYSSSTPTEIAAVEQHYIDWTKADNASASQLDGLIRLSTDQTFACPTEYFARGLEAAGANVYRYEMTHDPSLSVYAGVPQWTGASHAEDLQYVFGWGLNPPLSGVWRQTPEEKFMSIEFMRYWSNFVKSGNPNEPLHNHVYPDWPLYTMPDQEYKKLSLDMSNGRAMRAASCSFWLNYAPRLHTQTAPIEEVYEEWKEDYERWRDTDMPGWTTEFENYKDNQCPTPTTTP